MVNLVGKMNTLTNQCEVNQKVYDLSSAEALKEVETGSFCQQSRLLAWDIVHIDQQ